MSSVNADKLSKLQAQARADGPRRKMKKAVKVPGGDDKKLQAALKKLNVQPIPGIEEINMFQDDGNVLHFKAPKVQAAVNANTFAISGHGEEKELTELAPGILTQLGPESIASLRKIAEAYQAHVASGKGSDDIPELVENLSLNDEDEKATA